MGGRKGYPETNATKKRVLLLEREFKSIDKSSIRYAELQKEIFSNKVGLDKLQQQIKSSNPLYDQSFLESNILTVRDLRQNILKDHQTIVKILSGDSAVYILNITATKSYLKKIDKSLSTVYASFISNPDLLNRNFKSFTRVSFRLYQIIFKNINLPTGRIIISPDGHYFPFEALVTNNHPLTYFLDDHAVSYAYSARYLLNNFTTNSAFNSPTFIGFAPVKYANGLAALIGSDQSLQRMQNFFTNATRLDRDESTKNNFLQEYYKYKIVQLYTHAMDSGYAGDPVIYFSDSALSLSDLF